MRSEARRPHGARRGELRDDSGGATVEFALVMPALVLLLSLITAVAGWAAAQVRATGAAATAARVAAVEGDAAGLGAGRRQAPGIELTLRRDSGWVTVTAEGDAWGLPVAAEATFREQP